MKKLIIKYQRLQIEFIKIINSISPEQRKMKVFGNWNLMQVMMHIIGWQKITIERLDDIKKGIKQAEWVENMDQYNDKSLSLRKRWSWNKTYKEFKNIGEQLIRTYENMPKNLWNKPIWKERPTTPKTMLKGVGIGHTHQHLKEIKRKLEPPFFA